MVYNDHEVPHGCVGRVAADNCVGTRIVPDLPGTQGKNRVLLDRTALRLDLWS